MAQQQNKQFGSLDDTKHSKHSDKKKKESDDMNKESMYSHFQIFSSHIIWIKIKSDYHNSLEYQRNDKKKIIFGYCRKLSQIGYSSYNYLIPKVVVYLILGFYLIINDSFVNLHCFNARIDQYFLKFTENGKKVDWFNNTAASEFIDNLYHGDISIGWWRGLLLWRNIIPLSGSILTDPNSNSVYKWIVVIKRGVLTVNPTLLFYIGLDSGMFHRSSDRNIDKFYSLKWRGKLREVPNQQQLTLYKPDIGVSYNYRGFCKVWVEPNRRFQECWAYHVLDCKNGPRQYQHHKSVEPFTMHLEYCAPTGVVIFNGTPMVLPKENKYHLYIEMMQHDTIVEIKDFSIIPYSEF